MLFRFCLYGFLKNQRYFEPFLLLALRAKGLSYFQVGLLVALRAVVVNLLEVPSGAAADLFGRRRAMILAFAAYFLSFLIFARAGGFAALALAMGVFGVGEAFRTGSHKALIFTWLDRRGRGGDKTRVYGLTRSWSKYGSAISALVAAALVYGSADYGAVFLWSLLPVGLSIANLLGYPASIDPLPATRPAPADVVRHMRHSLTDSVRSSGLRRCLAESMGFNGLFFAVKDYAQPALVAVGAAWLAGAGEGLADAQRTALITGPVYFVFFLGAGFASRSAHAFSTWSGGDEAAARRLWAILAVLMLSMAGAALGGLSAAVLLSFAAFHVLQNWWRPILMSRIYDQVEENQGATIMSMESQAHRIGTALLAPVLGWLVDASGSLWPLAALGAVVACGFLLTGRRSRSGTPPPMSV